MRPDADSVAVPAVAVWPRASVVALVGTLILAVAYRLLSIPATDRLIVHDEVPLGPTVINAGLIFGMTFENWEFPNYMLPLLNGVDGAVGALLALVTQDWRVAKIVQYAMALGAVTIGFWHASGRLTRPGAGGTGELDALRVVATACYVLSPYSFTQMNNGTFWAFSVYFAIALMPAILAAACRLAVESPEPPGFMFGLLAGICSWWLPLIAVVVCSCALLLLSLPGLPRLPALKRAAPFATGLAVGLLPVLVASYFTLVKPGYEGDFKLQANATYGIIQGGILTPLLQRFSWILYVGWDMKAVHSFFADFDTPLVRLTYLVGLALLVHAALRASLRTRLGRLLSALLLVFACSIFFAKGSSFPFGSLFVAIIDSFSGFGVIRTPDTKFGMSATAALMLAWVAAGACGAFVRRALLVVGACYLAAAISTFYSGVLIDPAGPGRYRASLSPDQREALRLVNEAQGPARVLIFPASSTTTYAYDGYSYVGRNFMAPSIDQPVVSAQAGIVGEKNSVKAVLAALDRMDVPFMREMGIRLVLIDKNKAYGRYRDFSRLDARLVRRLLDTPDVALLELLGSGDPFAATSRAGAKIPAELDRWRLVPAAFLVTIKPPDAHACTPCTVRVDTVASSHWKWIPLGTRDASVSPTRISHVGLAEWSVSTPGPAQWLVIHVPNIVLFVSMALAILLAIGVAGRALLRRLATRGAQPHSAPVETA